VLFSALCLAEGGGSSIRAQLIVTALGEIGILSCPPGEAQK
jgi:hypothetical protein